MTIGLMLLLVIAIANLPWVNDRVFLVWPVEVKGMWMRVGELTVYYFISLLLGIAFETHYAGDVYPQDWEFFATTVSLFLVFAVPGVIYRYQWLPMQQKFK
jgi:hypothetical protein